MFRGASTFVLLLLASTAPAQVLQAERHVVRAQSETEARAWGARIDAMAARGELQLLRVEPDTDFPGRRHLRYDQHVGGVPVFGAQLVRQVDAFGETLTVFGRLQDLGPVPTVPALSADQAARAAEAQAPRGTNVVGEPELVLLPLPGRIVLAWMLWTSLDRTLDRVFVDARTGSIVFSYNDLRTQAPASAIGVGVWGDRKKMSVALDGGRLRAIDLLRPPTLTTLDLRGGFIISTAFIAENPDGNWMEGPVVDAHVYAGWTYDYYFKRFNRRGVDGRDLSVRSVVNASPIIVDPVNAGWSPALRTAFYGSGDGTYGPFSGALDVVSHELTHGVTQFTWDGLGFGESGALNEAFSDIMGTAVEFFHQPPGVGRLMAEYLLGEDLLRVFDPARAVRSMRSPAAICNQAIGCHPDNYVDLYRGPLNNGGVHHNSTIASHAFYLLVEGGVNRTSGLPVQGLGAANLEKAERIFYRGFTLYLTPSATFSDARAATVRAARELYGAASMEAAQTEAAWTAVGVQ